MHTLSLGDVRLTILDDGTLRFPAQAFFRGVPAQAWHEQAAPDSDGNIPVGHNCLLVETADELILIDTGYGADTHGGCTGHLLAELDGAGRRADEVTAVINTHVHGDHIKGNTLMREGKRVPAFPNALYVVGRADWEWFKGPAGRVHELEEHIVLLQQLEMLALADGDVRLTPEVRLVPTPGHTPGHMTVLVESMEQTAIFLGDLCHHPLHVLHPDWVSEFDTHPDMTPETRRRLFALAADRDALVIMPHAPVPGIGTMARDRDGFRWQAGA